MCEEERAPDGLGLTVIGVGAPAGAFHDVRALLRGLPATLRAAVVVQPTYSACWDELLESECELPIRRTTHGTPIEPSTVYLGRPELTMTRIAGQLCLAERPFDSSLSPIDELFVAIAESDETPRIGILLGAAEHEGTHGVSAIQEAGGLVLIADHEKENGMRQQSIDSGVTSLVVPPEQIGKAVARYCETFRREKIYRDLLVTSYEELDRTNRELEQARDAIREHEHDQREHLMRLGRARFLAVLSHELRNPIAAIASASHVLSSTTDPQLAPAAAALVRQTEHLKSLLDQLLDVSSATFEIDDDELAPDADECQTPALMDEALDIVVVDDHEDHREMLSMFVGMRGHRATAVADGEDAVITILHTQPDLSLIDIGLPDLDGYEVARRVRAFEGGKSLFLVALTGYGRPEDRDSARAAGFDEHWVKPLTREGLAQLLAKATQRRRARER